MRRRSALRTRRPRASRCGRARSRRPPRCLRRARGGRCRGTLSWPARRRVPAGASVGAGVVWRDVARDCSVVIAVVPSCCRSVGGDWLVRGLVGGVGALTKRKTLASPARVLVDRGAWVRFRGVPYLGRPPVSRREPVRMPISSSATSSSLATRDTSDVIRQLHGHTPTVRADRDGDETTMPVLLTHQATSPLGGEVDRDSTRRPRTMSTQCRWSGRAWSLRRRPHGAGRAVPRVGRSVGGQAGDVGRAGRAVSGSWPSARVAPSMHRRRFTCAGRAVLATRTVVRGDSHEGPHRGR